MSKGLTYGSGCTGEARFVSQSCQVLYTRRGCLARKSRRRGIELAFVPAMLGALHTLETTSAISLEIGGVTGGLGKGLPLRGTGVWLANRSLNS